MKRPLIFMFSGQGSHYCQMGKDLYDHHPVFRDAMEKGDAIVQRILQRSITSELYQYPVSINFDDLLMTHPALVMVEHALYQVLVSEGIEPDYVWGSSVGEFASAVAAGVWNMETALATAIEQARNIVQNCPLGGMIAILASPEIYQNSKELKENATLTGINFSNHFTISAEARQLKHIESYLKGKKINYQRLPVSYAFHSAGIDKAKDSFEHFYFNLTSFDPPRIPFLSSMTAGQLNKISQNYFWEVVRRPIQFQKTVMHLEQKNHSVFIDCGSSGTLATFIKYNLSPDSRSSCFPILTPFQQGKRHLNLLKNHLKPIFT